MLNEVVDVVDFTEVKVLFLATLEGLFLCAIELAIGLLTL